MIRLVVKVSLVWPWMNFSYLELAVINYRVMVLLYEFSLVDSFTNAVLSLFYKYWIYDVGVYSPEVALKRCCACTTLGLILSYDDDDVYSIGLQY